MQVADHLHDALAFGTLVVVVFQAVVGNQVHHRVLALEQAQDAVHFFLAVVDALEQRPLVLDGIADAAGIAFAQLHQFVRGNARRLGQQLLAQVGPGGVQR
ncbi:hypothetical protein D9M72_350450 [compost metagenome]